MSCESSCLPLSKYPAASQLFQIISLYLLFGFPHQSTHLPYLLLFSIYFLIHILRCLLSTLVLHALISLLRGVGIPSMSVNAMDTEGLDRIDGMSGSQSPQMEKEGCFLWGKLEHGGTSFHPQKRFNLWA